MSSLMECFVYVLYEPDHIKIGMSDSPARRAREVMPEADKEASYALVFDNRKKARNCEVALHRFFSTYHLPTKNRQGRTEFFNRSCAEKLHSFVANNNDLLGYKEIRRGSSLFIEESLSKQEREIRKIVRQGEEKLLRQNENEKRKAAFLEAFQKLKEQNCMVGLMGNVENFTNSSIFLVFNDAQRELVDNLRWNSAFYDQGELHYLLKQNKSEHMQDIEEINPEFYDDMTRVFGNAGPNYTILDVAGCPENIKIDKKIRDNFCAHKNICALPVIEGEKLSIIKEVLDIAGLPGYLGINIYEEKADGTERRAMFLVRNVPSDEIALRMCHAYWNENHASSMNGNSQWHYVLYKRTARTFTKIAILGRSQGDERYSHPDNSADSQFDPNPVIAKSEKEYEILNMHSVRLLGNHETDSMNGFIYFNNDPQEFYVAAPSRAEAYRRLQELCKEKGWRIIKP